MCSQLLHGGWDQNSGSHAYATNPSPTEPSPQPQGGCDSSCLQTSSLGVDPFIMGILSADGMLTITLDILDNEARMHKLSRSALIQTHRGVDGRCAGDQGQGGPVNCWK